MYKNSSDFSMYFVLYFQTFCIFLEFMNFLQVEKIITI